VPYFPYKFCRNILLTVFGVCVIMSPVFAEQNSARQILMAGDSTMAIKDPKDYPETGWGVPFATFFAEDVKVYNFSKNGRSTRTFREEGLWQQLLDLCHPNDIVFIQFGHNDEVPSKVDRYSTPEQYKDNLIQYIKEVREKKAQAILLSPITRRYFNEIGVIDPTHPYTELVKEVAEQTGVEYIDMDKISRDYFSALGESNSTIRFMHIKPGIHPNYPNGVRDDTHFNELGAREVAQLLLTELRARNHPLLKQLRQVDPKHLHLHY
jgi:lysophospholipase L1-like esterase